MDKNTKIKVLNRDNGVVVYSVPEMNGLKRVYQAGQVKQVTFEELEKISYTRGGRALLEDNLAILNNPQAVKILLGQVEPEYNYSKDDIIKLMTQGSLDEFLDCLDFAPEGVIDLIKTLAVTLPLNDVNKRTAILNKTGFNVDNAITINNATFESEGDKKEATTQRRVKTSTNTTSRRVVKEK